MIGKNVSTSELQINLDKKFEENIAYMLKEATTSLAVIEELNPDFNKSIYPPLMDPFDFYIYYKNVCSYSYICAKRMGNIYSFNLMRFSQLLQEIGLDERVYFINKPGILGYAQIIHELRIVSALLDVYAKSIFERGKEGNWVFKAIKEAVEFEPTNPSLNYKDQVEQMVKDAFFKPIKMHLRKIITVGAKLLQVNPSDIENAMTIFYEGDMRSVELHLLPNLYKCLLLKKEWESEKIGDFSPTKKDILFDILCFICPDRELIYSNQKNPESLLGSKYQGSYYRYRINTVKAIIGQ